MSTTATLIELFSGLVDSNGDPLSGYQVRTYAADGSTAQAVWEDRAKSLPSSVGKTSFSIGTDSNVEVYGDAVYIIKLWTPTADPDVDSPYDTFGPNSFQPGGSAFDGDASDISILDVGSLITATDVDGALTENRTAINLNTTHRTSDGSDHSDVVSNTKTRDDHGTISTGSEEISAGFTNHTLTTAGSHTWTFADFSEINPEASLKLIVSSGTPTITLPGAATILTSQTLTNLAAGDWLVEIVSFDGGTSYEVLVKEDES